MSEFEMNAREEELFNLEYEAYLDECEEKGENPISEREYYRKYCH